MNNILIIKANEKNNNKKFINLVKQQMTGGSKVNKFFIKGHENLRYIYIYDDSCDQQYIINKKLLRGIDESSELEINNSIGMFKFNYYKYTIPSKMSASLNRCCKYRLKNTGKLANESIFGSSDLIWILQKRIEGEFIKRKGIIIPKWINLNLLNEDQLTDIESQLLSSPELSKQALTFLIETQDDVPTLREADDEKLVCIVFNTDDGDFVYEISD